MHRFGLDAILIMALGLAFWGISDLANIDWRELTSSAGATSILTVAFAYLGVVKIFGAVLLAVLCIGFDGLLAAAAKANVGI